MLKRTPNTNSINNHNKSEGCCCLLAGFCTQAVAASVCIDYFFKSSYYLLSQVQHICDSICSTACLLLTQPRHRTFAFATALFTCVLQCSYQLFLQLRTFVAVYNHLAALRSTRQSIKCLQRLTGNSFGQPLTHAFTQSSFAGCVNLSICVALCHDQLSHSMNNSVPPRLKCISCILRFVYSPPACVPEYVLILACSASSDATASSSPHQSFRFRICKFVYLLFFHSSVAQLKFFVSLPINLLQLQFQLIKRN